MAWELHICLHTSLERKQETYYRKVFFLQKLVVLLYVAVEKEYFFGDGILVKDDEITDIQKIPVLMEVADTCGNLHEKKEFAVDTTIVLQYIVDASDVRDDGYLMKMDELQEYVPVGGVLRHDFYECGNLVYFFLVEGNKLPFPERYRFFQENYLEKKHSENCRYKSYKYKNGI